MPTKIGHFDSNPVQVSTGKSVKGAAGAKSSPAQSGGTESTSDAHITDSARKLAALEQTVRDLPAIDEARVQQVGARIANGSYKVDAERVADKLLRSDQDLATHEDPA